MKIINAYRISTTVLLSALLVAVIIQGNRIVHSINMNSGYPDTQDVRVINDSVPVSVVPKKHSIW